MITFACAKCGTSNLAHEQQAGQPMVCPNCGNTNLVPPAAGFAQQAAPSQPPPSSGFAPTGSSPASAHDVNMWAMFCHLAAFVGFVGIPLGHIVGPLVVWLIKGKTHPFIDASGKASLNFQILMMICAVVSVPLCFVFIGIPLLAAVYVFDTVCVILAAVAANRGQTYKYPFTVHFVK